VARLVAVGAVGRGVLAVERPAGLLVIEALLAALDRRPAHDVVAALLVLVVAGLALLALDVGRGVEPLAGGDPGPEVVVVVAAQALVVRHVARAVDVAVVALVLGVPLRVAGGQRPRRAREEIAVGVRPAGRERRDGGHGQDS